MAKSPAAIPGHSEKDGLRLFPAILRLLWALTKIALMATLAVLVVCTVIALVGLALGAGIQLGIEIVNGWAF